ncbi:MAG: DUF935 family protein [Acidobacteriota bacterium]
MLEKATLKLQEDNGRPGAPVTDVIADVRKDIDIFAGFLKALPNPDVIFKEQPARGIRIYTDILRDAHTRSVFQTRRLAVVGKEWTIQTASDDARDLQVRDFVEETINGIRKFERARFDLLDGLFKGFAVGEILWRVDNGRVLPTEIKRRGQHRFAFDFDGRPRLKTLANIVEGEALPDRKFLVFQYEADDENPYGIGLGQSIYWPWWFKKHGIKYWVIFMERFGMPTVEGKYPPGTHKDQQDALLTVLRSIQQDTAYKIPNNMEITFREAQRSSTVAVYDPFLDKMNAEISKAVVGQTATTEGTPGKLGSEEARSEVRHDLVEADADLMDEIMTNQLIRWIVDFNFGPDVAAPWFHTKTEADQDLVALASRDQLLHGMGARITERYIHETYGLPVPEGDEPVLPPPSGPPSPVAGLRFAEADPAQDLPGARDRDRLERTSVERGIDGFMPIRRAIEAHLDKKKDLAQALVGLGDAVTDDEVGSFAMVIETAMITGELLGRSDIVDEARLPADASAQAGGASRSPVFQEDFPPLTPEGALAFFRDKVAMTEAQFADLKETMGTRAFTVARISNRQATEFIRGELERAIREGSTFEQFRGRLNASWGRFGITEVSPHHLQTAFNNNVGDAYMKGRGKQLFEDPDIVDDFPFFQYHSALLPTSRPTHVAMHGVIRHRNDPVWQRWWPLNGHNCHCSVTAISRAEIALNGIQETPVPGVNPDPGWESGPLG